MTVACLNLGLTPDEALAAVTINAAYAIGHGRGDRVARRRARPPTSWSGVSRLSRQIPYWPAADLVRTVVKRGRVVSSGTEPALGLAAGLQEDRRGLGRQARRS